MKLAGVMSTRNYSRFPGVFPVLAAMSDITIVLDDGSSEPFPYRDQATEYLYLKRSGPWNAGGNLTTLVYRAFLHGCDWVILCDDDMLPSATLFRNVRMLVDQKQDIVYVQCRDLWNDAEHYRVDGPWANKDFPFLIRNWFFDPNLTLITPPRLHKSPWPVRQQWYMAPLPFAVYHLGSLSAQQRRERVEKHEREDPQFIFQENYSYLADETGLIRAKVPDEDHVLLHQWMRC
jgi:hypothetical protein